MILHQRYSLIRHAGLHNKPKGFTSYINQLTSGKHFIQVGFSGSIPDRYRINSGSLQKRRTNELYEPKIFFELSHLYSNFKITRIQDSGSIPDHDHCECHPKLNFRDTEEKI